ncbi:hypothetical protein, partial [Bifidobacterium longum]|uniref:hypothetical protein n=1 Tax=Bifidobacterium longum TaxID=216816 RepID=UPI001F3A175B
VAYSLSSRITDLPPSMALYSSLIMAVLLAWLYWYAPRYYYRGRFAPFAAPCLSWLFYLFYLFY